METVQQEGNCKLKYYNLDAVISVDYRVNSTCSIDYDPKSETTRLFYAHVQEKFHYAITLFGDKNTKNVVLEKSYKEYMEGFTDLVTGQARRGFMAVVSELEQLFPNPDEIELEQDMQDF